VWQEIREELHPHGFELVTVALDTAGADAARPWIERATPRHPSLVDQAHTLDALLGVVNVPSGVWFDESGLIVRPPETAYPRRPSFLDRVPRADDPPHVVERLNILQRLRIDADSYVSALREWVTTGAHALSAEQLNQRSRSRSWDEASAAAHFELAQHLVRTAQPDKAVRHFRAAHRLQPDNWTYKRQAWSLVDPTQGPTREYEGDWLSDVRRIGPENYYPALHID
jgi:hypothetical protein